MREFSFRIWHRGHESTGVKPHWDTRKTGWVANQVQGWGDVMQYTGLKDKNGVEIYESDILHHDLWGNSQIIWEQGGFRGIGNEHDVTLADHQLNRSRVIGNIYDNPELEVHDNG